MNGRDIIQSKSRFWILSLCKQINLDKRNVYHRASASIDRLPTLPLEFSLTSCWQLTTFDTFFTSSRNVTHNHVQSCAYDRINGHENEVVLLQNTTYQLLGIQAPLSCCRALPASSDASCQGSVSYLFYLQNYNCSAVSSWVYASKCPLKSSAWKWSNI